MLDQIYKVCKKIQDHGGKAYIVGGFVRDMIMKKNTGCTIQSSLVNPTDIDIEVFNLQYEQLLSIFGDSAKICGKSFGVLKVGNIDISIPRREKKIGSGHKGFEIDSDPHMDIKEALSRRDFTINAILWDPIADSYIDPFCGISDISNKILRHISWRFVEDPLRVLRGAQFISRFKLSPKDKTIDICRMLKDSMNELSKERIYGEFLKLANGSHHEPALYFLKSTGWIDNFPELVDLNYTMCICRVIGYNRHDHIDFFSALLRNIENPRLFFEKYFAGYLNSDLEEIIKLTKLYDYNKFINLSDTRIRKFMHIYLKGTTLNRFALIVKAVNHDLSYIPYTPERFLEKCKEYADNNPLYPIIKGQDLVDLGFKPGPEMGNILKYLYNSQIEYGYSKEKLLDLLK